MADDILASLFGSARPQAQWSPSLWSGMPGGNFGGGQQNYAMGALGSFGMLGGQAYGVNMQGRVLGSPFGGGANVQNTALLALRSQMESVTFQSSVARQNDVAYLGNLGATLGSRAMGEDLAGILQDPNMQRMANMFGFGSALRALTPSYGTARATYDMYQSRGYSMSNMARLGAAAPQDMIKQMMGASGWAGGVYSPFQGGAANYGISAADRMDMYTYMSRQGMTSGAFNDAKTGAVSTTQGLLAGMATMNSMFGPVDVQQQLMNMQTATGGAIGRMSEDAVSKASRSFAVAARMGGWSSDTARSFTDQMQLSAHARGQSTVGAAIAANFALGNGRMVAQTAKSLSSTGYSDITTEDATQALSASAAVAAESPMALQGAVLLQALEHKDLKDLPADMRELVDHLRRGVGTAEDAQMFTSKNANRVAALAALGLGTTDVGTAGRMLRDPGLQRTAFNKYGAQAANAAIQAQPFEALAQAATNADALFFGQFKTEESKARLAGILGNSMTMEGALKSINAPGNGIDEATKAAMTKAVQGLGSGFNAEGQKIRDVFGQLNTTSFEQVAAQANMGQIAEEAKSMAEGGTSAYQALQAVGGMEGIAFTPDKLQAVFEAVHAGHPMDAILNLAGVVDMRKKIDEGLFDAKTGGLNATGKSFLINNRAADSEYLSQLAVGRGVSAGEITKMLEKFDAGGTIDDLAKAVYKAGNGGALERMATGTVMGADGKLVRDAVSIDGVALRQMSGDGHILTSKEFKDLARGANMSEGDFAAAEYAASKKISDKEKVKAAEVEKQKSDKKDADVASIEGNVSTSVDLFQRMAASLDIAAYALLGANGSFVTS